MELDIINRKDINKFVVDLMFNNQEIPPISADKLKDLQYLTKNKDTVVRAILAQYLKAKIPGYISEIKLNENGKEDIDKTLSNKPYLEPVAANDVSEEWARNKIAKGGQLFTFNPDKVSDDLKDTLTKARDFLYSKVSDKIDTEIKQKNKDPNYKLKVSLSFLKEDVDSNPFGKVLAAADKWHKEMAAHAEQIKKDAEFKRLSEAGTTKVVDLEDGCYAVQLTTPEALDFESDHMGHCVGKGGYDKGVENGTTRIYSIRDPNGEPHVTFEVRQNKEGKWAVYQCQGKQNKAPIAQYRPAVTLFMNKMGFEIEGDKKNLGLIKQDGKYYDIWHLPKGFVIEGDLDLSGMGLTELPDLSGVTIKGNFNCSGNKLTTLKGAPKEVSGKCRVCNNPIESFKDLPIYQGGKQYNLYDLPKGFVIEGDLDLSEMGLTELPNLSDVIVKGTFDCSGNKLTTLKGAPKKVGGHFYCLRNQLTTLEGAPKEVGGDFSCNNNQLTTLEGAPEKVGGDFRCSSNQLKTLKGAPKKVGGHFYCLRNQLTTLEGAPKEIGGDFSCSDNQLTTLEGAPKEIGGNFYCSDNQLTTLEGAPKEVGGIFSCTENKFNDNSTAPEYLLSDDIRIYGIDPTLLAKMVQNWKILQSATIKNFVTMQKISK